MKNLLAASTLVLAALAATPSQAAVVNFDDAYSGGVFNPATYYSGSHGLTISGAYLGVVGGNGNGDPGNWNLEGTNGSAFLGAHCFNGTCTQNYKFNVNLSSISMDIGVPGFDWTGSFTTTFLDDSVVVSSLTQSTSSPGDPGNWKTFSFVGNFDEVKLDFSFSSGFAMGVDNIQYTTNDVPEPATLALMGIAIAGLGAARRRKTA